MRKTLNNKKKKKGQLIFIGALLASLFLISFSLLEETFSQEIGELACEEKVFVLEKGQNIFQVADSLQEQGFLKSKTSFSLFSFWKGNWAKLKAGSYSLCPGMPASQILKKMVEGKIKKEWVLIFEGWTPQDIAERLESAGLIKADDFLAACENDYSAQFPFLKQKPRDLNLEGYLFPDTYEVKAGQKADELVETILENFQEKLEKANLFTQIDKSGKSLSEILTMASLLEMEVRTYQDKQIVAGILWKRISSGWPLQIDATLVRIFNKGGLNMTIEDMQDDSPYNTYKHKGLPPGPISNPGLDSIKAALNYKDSAYWYYLSAKDGATIFAKTLAEQERNKDKYLK